MKLRCILSGCIAALASQAADAQSNIILYGRIDTGIRYSSNQDIAGGKLLEVTSGASSGSRWGVKGSEDLGGGMKAVFTLENGFEPDTGKAAQSGRLFGRQAWLGLSGSLGTLTVGRQYSPVYNVEFANEPFGWANVYESGFIYDNYTGGNRWDNSVLYQYKGGHLSGTLMTGFGEQAGSNRNGSKVGGSIAYEIGLGAVSAAYQKTHDVNGVADHKVWTAGGFYPLGGFKLFLSYLNHRSDLTPQKNDVWAAGASYAAGPAVELYGGFYYDRQRQQSGNKRTVVGMFNYKLSKRTNVYLQADYSKIDAGYVSNLFDVYAFPVSRDASGVVSAFVKTRTSAMVGIRHQF
ncbi:porin [Collimonas pratensis]|uniref:Gram-negative porin family protein n=1 Tax=Collimonas pratensis TaxID=279113 RepID=A0A127Q020_9BURK|nr:porin [Collimonas pratensis]AMP03398.1 gram-negative porin family protein [Collimonas pratensis]NKI67956.1 porin [Collimonas pratensis]